MLTNAKSCPYAQEAKRIYNYDPETGAITWRVAKRGRPIGSSAGSVGVMGYRLVRVLDKKMLAGRVAWLLATGSWPDGVISRKNGDSSDDRFENLRDLSKSESQQNYAKPRNNTSGHVGVCWDKRDSQWMAQIWHNGRIHKLGRFSDKEDAVRAYAAGKAALHLASPIPQTRLTLVRDKVLS